MGILFIRYFILNCRGNELHTVWQILPAFSFFGTEWGCLTRGNLVQVQELSKKYGIPYRTVAKNLVRYRLAWIRRFHEILRKE